MAFRAGWLVALSTLAAVPALAQTDPVAMSHAAAANQLGVLQYCQAQGHTGEDVVTAERDVISRLPASALSTSDAEALGKQGTLAVPNGTSMTLSGMAAQGHTTVDAMCKQMASATLQAAASFKQNGMTGAGAMPGMPRGMTMPTMPAMPSMNGMPAMPAMPGMPPAK